MARPIKNEPITVQERQRIKNHIDSCIKETQKTWDLLRVEYDQKTKPTPKTQRRKFTDTIFYKRIGLTPTDRWASIIRSIINGSYEGKGKNYYHVIDKLGL